MTTANLLALRAKLDEQTNEIQILQKAVEQATQSTIDQLSLSFPGNCRKHSTNNQINTLGGLCSSSLVRGDPSVTVPIQTLPLKRPQCLDLTSQGQTQKNLDEVSCPIDTPAVKTSSWFSDSQRKREEYSHKTGQQPDCRQTISGLDLKCQQFRKQRNSEMDMSREKGSKVQQETHKNLQSKIQELETTNEIQEEMLKQAHVYNEILKDMLKKRDRILQGIQTAVYTYHEQSAKNVETDPDLCSLGESVEKIFQEMADELSYHKEEANSVNNQLLFMKRKLEDKEACLKQYQERHDNLLNEHEQEVAVLRAEMNAAKAETKSAHYQMEALQDKNTKHVEHIADLELEVSQLQSDLQNSKKSYEENIEEMKKQLLEANTVLEETRNKHAKLCKKQEREHQQLREVLKMTEKQLSLEKAHSKQLQDQEAMCCLTNEQLRRELTERSMEVNRLQASVDMVKEESRHKAEQQRRIIQETTSSLNLRSSQLESIKDTLQRTVEELAVKTKDLETAEKLANELKTLLAEKDNAVQAAVDEQRRLRLYAEDKTCEVHKLKVHVEKISDILKDSDALKLLLVEKDNMIVTLRAQVEAVTRMIGQQNEKLGALEAEKSQLLKDVATIKAERQDVKIKAEKKDERIAELEEMCTALELEKAKLTNSGAKKSLAAKKLRKEKEELANELRETQGNLASLSEDYKRLKRNYVNHTGDKEHMTTILKMQLKTALAELEQTKNTLKTVEDCDGHAFQIATRMQKKITAKREQIDTLQSRIHFLEEALFNVTKDKHNQKVEKTKLMKECCQEATERNKLSTLLEIMRSENNSLKDNAARTEAALEKTVLQLSDCQAKIQRLEQEAVCLRLQHTLDLKELKGPISADIPTKQFSLNTPVFFTHSTDLPVTDTTKPNEPSVKRCMLDVVHLSDSLTSLPCKDEAALKQRKDTDRTSPVETKEQVTLHAGNFEDHFITLIQKENCLVEPFYSSSPKKNKTPEIKPRSPVHCLLTAPASEIDYNYNLDSPTNLPPADDFAFDEQYGDLTSSTCQSLQHRFECLQSIAKDLQTKNKEMSLMFESKKYSRKPD